MSAGIDKLVDFLLNAIGMFKFWTVLDEYEMGVLLRLGRFHRLLEPGFHWIRPFYIDKPITDNVVTRTKDLGEQRLVTKDGKTVAVTAFVTCRITDIRKSLLEVESVDDALIDACSASILAHGIAHTWDELRVSDSEIKLARGVRAQGRAYGIEIERIQLKDLAPCRVISLHGGKL